MSAQEAKARNKIGVMGAIGLLALPRVRRFAAGMVSFLNSACRQPLQHLAAFSYFFFGIGAAQPILGSVIDEAERESSTRVNRSRRGDAAADRVLSGLSTHSTVSLLDGGIALAWGTRTIGTPTKDDTGDTKSQARETSFEFRATYRQDAQNRLHSLRGSFNFPRFFPGAAIVRCLHALVALIHPPSNALCRAIGKDFPALSEAFSRVVDTRRVSWFDPTASGLDGAGPAPICLRLPLSFTALQQYHPAVASLIRKVARMRVVFEAPHGDTNPARIVEADFNGREIVVRAQKSGDSLVWWRGGRGSGGRGSGATIADTVLVDHTAGKIFSFDLTRSCREGLIMRLHLEARVLGITIALPSVVVRLVARVEKAKTVAPQCVLTATIASIEPSLLTRFAVAMIGMSGVFDAVRRSFSMRFALGSGTDPDLDVHVDISWPRSRVISAYVWANLSSFVSTWLGLLGLAGSLAGGAYADVTSALKQSEQTDAKQCGLLSKR